MAATSLPLTHGSSSNPPPFNGKMIAARLQEEDCNITTLDLGLRYITTQEPIGSEDVEYIAEALKKNKSVTTLNLYRNHIGTKEAKLIADALIVNNTITTLNLGANNIGNEGALLIAQALKVNRTITTLCLSDNNIGDKGAIAIAEALKNNIGDKGAIAIVEAKKNHSITTLDLGGNRIGNEGATAIAQMLRFNDSIKTLNLESNKIGDQGAHQFDGVLSNYQHCSITTLYLESNKIASRLEERIHGLVLAKEARERYYYYSLEMDLPKSDYGIGSVQSMFSKDNHIEFNIRKIRCEEAEKFNRREIRCEEADKYVVPDKYSSSLANLYKAMINRPEFKPILIYRSVPDEIRKIYLSLPKEDKILIHQYARLCSGLPAEKEDYHTLIHGVFPFRNKNSFYCAVQHAIIHKYEMLKTDELDRSIQGLAYGANEPLTPEVYRKKWVEQHAKQNLMRLALALAMAEKPASAVSSSISASSSSPSPLVSNLAQVHLAPSAAASSVPLPIETVSSSISASSSSPSPLVSNPALVHLPPSAAASSVPLPIEKVSSSISASSSSPSPLVSNLALVDLAPSAAASSVPLPIEKVSSSISASSSSPSPHSDPSLPTLVHLPPSATASSAPPQKETAKLQREFEESHILQRESIETDRNSDEEDEMFSF